MTPDEYEEENRQYWFSVEEGIYDYREERLKLYREHREKAWKHFDDADKAYSVAYQSFVNADSLLLEMMEYLSPDVCIEEMNERTLCNGPENCVEDC